MNIMRTIPREVRKVQVWKLTFSLSREQEDVLLGTLFGDGTLQCRGYDFRLHVKHGGKQLSYVEYKHKVFQNCTSMPVRIFSQKVLQKDYQFAEFVTQTHPCFTTYNKLFYIDGKKHITEKVCKLFQNPKSIAVWFMDDGSAEYTGAAFNTQCFEEKEVFLLRKVLCDRFLLETTQRRNKGGWVIYVPKKNMTILRNLVKDYLLPEFFYKLMPYTERRTP